MIGGTTKDLNFKFRSKTKWDKEWQTLIVTGIPVERDKKGNVIRYTGIKVNNTKWGENGTATKGAERQS